MKDERGPWYLLTGLAIGIILGVLIAWGVQPAEYVDTMPSSLRADFKDQYRALIASAYMANGDLVRAKARLELLEDDDLYRVLAEQAQRTLAQEGSSAEARALGLLAIMMGQEISGGAPPLPPTQIPTQLPSNTPTASSTLPPTSTTTPTDTPTFTPTLTSTPTLPRSTPAPTGISATLTATFEQDGTPTETPIPRPTSTPTLTRTATRTPGAPFVLVRSERVCEREYPQPLITIYAVDASGQPAPGILVIITWGAGEERFYTGLKPEIGLGYADFSILPGTAYSVRLQDVGEPVSGISAVDCQAPGGDHYWGAWRLDFEQP